jgi:hypothetical protein
MRPALLLVAALALAAASPAEAAPSLLISASPAAATSGSAANACPVLLQLRNTTRMPVSMVGRLEGHIGDSDFPSFRAFQFDNIAPGRTGAERIEFDGDCGSGRITGRVVVRQLFMCHAGLTRYFDCHQDIAAENPAGGGLQVVVDFSGQNFDGLGDQVPAAGGPASPPAR